MQKGMLQQFLILTHNQQLKHNLQRQSGFLTFVRYGVNST